MKISLFLSFACICQLVAMNTTAQNAVIEVNKGQLSLREFVKEIEEQTDYLVVFGHNDIDMDTKVTVKSKSAKVVDYLDTALAEANVSYLFDNNYIILKSKSSTSLSDATNASQEDKRRVIRGVIRDNQNEPLTGVSISEKGTSNGIVSDVDGNYSLRVETGSTLVFSCIGFISQEIQVTNKTTIDVSLVENQELLDEVVIVGYGVQKKEVVTGAITTLKSDDITLSPSGNVAAGLAGRLSGVIINTRSGEAGNEGTSIFIRGRSTTGGGTEPLYVIDGIARNEEGGILSRLEPNDIETITVLKDASAAIYGSRAANGVILITTKRGKVGKKPTINVSYNHSFAQPTRVVKMADAATYAHAQNLANGSKGLGPTWTADEIQKFADGSDPLYYPNTDWYRTVQSTWSHQDKANLQVTGGSDNVQYFVSGGLLNQGSPYNDGFTSNRQVNVRSNIDARINKYIKIGLDMSAKKTRRVLPRDGGVAASMYAHVFLNLPTIHAYWPGTKYAAPARDGDNPVVQTSGEAGSVNTDNWILNGQTTMTVDIPWVKGLSFDGSFAYDYFSQQHKQFKKVAYVYDYDQSTDIYNKMMVPTVKAPTLNSEEKRNESVTGNIRMNYKNTFLDLHTVDAFLGFEQNEYKYSRLFGERSNFPSGALGEIDFGDDNTTKNGGTSSKEARQNYFGRLLYDFDNKYMLQFQFRYDGSQRFSPGRRFGFFPGVSAGWGMSKEKFMENISWLDNLKFRGSWGKMGNDQVPAYQYLIMYGMSSGNVFDGDVAQGISQANTPNPYITWETAQTYNLGFESRFLKDRLLFEFDWFKTRRNHILTKRNLSIPSFTGLSIPDENIGIAENKGVELMATFRDQIGKDFSYSVSGNFTYARSKVIYADEVPSAEPYQMAEGRPIGSHLRYKAIGLYSEADIQDPKVAKRPGTMAGDIKIWDANNDGEINSQDRIRQDLTDVPEIIYGININLGWKQFDMVLAFQGQAHATYTIREDWVDPSNGGAGNLMKWWTEDAWSPDNPNGTKPRLGTPNRIGGTTFTQMSAAFFKLKNAELGYNIPHPVLNKVGLGSARIYVSGTNLLSIDNLGKFGVDPEARQGGWDLSPLRLINLGVNVSF